MEAITFEKRLAVSLLEKNTVESAFLHSFSQLSSALLETSGNGSHLLPEFSLEDAVANGTSDPKRGAQFLLLHSAIDNKNVDENVNGVERMFTDGSSGSGRTGVPNKKRKCLYDGPGRSGNQWSSKPADMVSMAKMEATIEERIEKLRKRGLWSPARLPKVMEPIRYKSQWDYVLDEMQWLSEDMHLERTWKLCIAKQLATDAVRHLQFKVRERQALQQEECARGMLVAHQVAAMVREWWGSVRECLEYARAALEVEEREELLNLKARNQDLKSQADAFRHKKWYRYVREMDHRHHVHAVTGADPNYVPSEASKRDEHHEDTEDEDEEEWKLEDNGESRLGADLEMDDSSAGEDDDVWLKDAHEELDLLQSEANMDLEEILRMREEHMELEDACSSPSSAADSIAEGTLEVVTLLQDETTAPIEELVGEDYLTFRKACLEEEKKAEEREKNAEESSSDASATDGEDAIDKDMELQEVQQCPLWHQRHSDLESLLRTIRDVYQTAPNENEMEMNSVLMQRLQLANTHRLPLILALEPNLDDVESPEEDLRFTEPAWAAGIVALDLRREALEHGCWGPHLLFTVDEHLLEWELQLKRLCPILALHIVTSRPETATGANIYLVSYSLLKSNLRWFTTFLHHIQWKKCILDSCDSLLSARTEEEFSLDLETIRRHIFSEFAPLLLVNRIQTVRRQTKRTLCMATRCTPQQVDTTWNATMAVLDDNEEDRKNKMAAVALMLECLMLPYPLYTLTSTSLTEFLLMAEPTPQQCTLEQDLLAMESSQVALQEGHVLPLLELIHDIRLIQQHPLLYLCEGDVNMLAEELTFRLQLVDGVHFHFEGLSFTSPESLLHLRREWRLLDEEEEVCFGDVCGEDAVQWPLLRKCLDAWHHEEVHSLLPRVALVEEMMNEPPSGAMSHHQHHAHHIAPNSAPESLLPSPQPPAEHNHEAVPWIHNLYPPPQKRIRLDDDLLATGGAGDGESGVFLNATECRTLWLEGLQEQRRIENLTTSVRDSGDVTASGERTQPGGTEDGLASLPSSPLVSSGLSSSRLDTQLPYRRSYSCTPSPQAGAGHAINSGDSASPSGRSTLAERKNRVVLKQRLQTRLKENEKRWQLILACSWSPWRVSGLRINVDTNLPSTIIPLWARSFPMRQLVVNTTRVIAPTVQCPAASSANLRVSSDHLLTSSHYHLHSPAVLMGISRSPKVTSHSLVAQSGKLLTLRNLLRTLLLHPVNSTEVRQYSNNVQMYRMNPQGHVLLVCHDEALLHLIHMTLALDPLCYDVPLVCLSALDPNQSSVEERSRTVEYINGLTLGSSVDRPVIVMMSAKWPLSGTCLWHMDPTLWTVICVDACDWKPTDNRRLLRRLKRWLHNSNDVRRQHDSNSTTTSPNPLLILRLVARSPPLADGPEDQLCSVLCEAALCEPNNVITNHWLKHVIATSSSSHTSITHMTSRPRRSASRQPSVWSRWQLTNPTCITLLFPLLQPSRMMKLEQQTVSSPTCDLTEMRLEELMSMLESHTNQLAAHSCWTNENDTTLDHNDWETRMELYDNSTDTCLPALSFEERLLPVEAFALSKCALWDCEMDSEVNSALVPVAMGSGSDAERAQCYQRMWRRWEKHWAQQQFRAECLWRELQEGAGFPHVCYSAPENREAMVLINPDTGHILEFYTPLPTDPNSRTLETMYVDASLRSLYTGECMLEAELPNVTPLSQAVHPRGNHHHHHTGARGAVTGGTGEVHRGTGMGGVHKHVKGVAVDGGEGEVTAHKMKGPLSKKARMEQRAAAMTGFSMGPNEVDETEDAVEGLQRKRTASSKGMTGGPVMKKRKGQLLANGSGAGPFKRPLDEPSAVASTGGLRATSGATSKAGRMKNVVHEKAPIVFLAGVPRWDADLLQDVCFPWPLDSSEKETATHAQSDALSQMYLVPRSFHLRSYVHFNGSTSIRASSLSLQQRRLHQSLAGISSATSTPTAKGRGPQSTASSTGGCNSGRQAYQMNQHNLEPPVAFTMMECVKLRGLLHLLQIVPLPYQSLMSSTAGEWSSVDMAAQRHANVTQPVPANMLSRKVLAAMSGSGGTQQNMASGASAVASGATSLTPSTSTTSTTNLPGGPVHLPVFSIDRQPSTLNFHLVEVVLNGVVANRQYRTYGACLRQYDDMMQRGGRMPPQAHGPSSSATVSHLPHTGSKKGDANFMASTSHRKGKQKLRPGMTAAVSSAPSSGGPRRGDESGDVVLSSGVSGGGLDSLADFMDYLSGLPAASSTTASKEVSGLGIDVLMSSGTPSRSGGTPVTSPIPNVSSGQTTLPNVPHSAGSMAKRRSGITVSTSGASNAASTSLSNTGQSSQQGSGGMPRPGALPRGDDYRLPGAAPTSSTNMSGTPSSASVPPLQMTFQGVMEKLRNEGRLYHMQRDRVVRERASHSYLMQQQQQHHGHPSAGQQPQSAQSGAHHPAHHHHDPNSLPGIPASSASAASLSAAQQQRRMQVQRLRAQQQQQQQQQQGGQPSSQQPTVQQSVPQSPSSAANVPGRPYVSTQLQQALTSGVAVSRQLSSGAGYPPNYAGASRPQSNVPRGIPSSVGPGAGSLGGHVLSQATPMHPSQLSSVNVNYNAGSGGGTSVGNLATQGSATISVQYLTLPQSSAASLSLPVSSISSSTSSTLTGFPVSSSTQGSTSAIMTRLLEGSFTQQHQNQGGGTVQLRTGQSTGGATLGYVPVQQQSQGQSRGGGVVQGSQFLMQSHPSGGVARQTVTATAPGYAQHNATMRRNPSQSGLLLTTSGANDGNESVTGLFSTGPGGQSHSTTGAATLRILPISSAGQEGSTASYGTSGAAHGQNKGPAAHSILWQSSGTTPGGAAPGATTISTAPCMRRQAPLVINLQGHQGGGTLFLQQPSSLTQQQQQTQQNPTQSFTTTQPQIRVINTSALQQPQQGFFSSLGGQGTLRAGVSSGAPQLVQQVRLTSRPQGHPQQQHHLHDPHNMDDR